jgi:hypothetical protein
MWSHFDVLLKSDLEVQQFHISDWYSGKKLMLWSIFRCYQMYKCQRFWSHFEAYLSQIWMLKKLSHEDSLLDKSSCLAPALVLSNVQLLLMWIWSKFVVLLKSDLDVQQIHLWDWYAGQKLMLSSNFRCYQMYKCQRFWSHFEALLKPNLDAQQTHPLGQFVGQKFMLSSSFRCYQMYNCC